MIFAVTCVTTSALMLIRYYTVARQPSPLPLSGAQPRKRRLGSGSSRSISRLSRVAGGGLTLRGPPAWPLTMRAASGGAEVGSSWASSLSSSSRSATCDKRARSAADRESFQIPGRMPAERLMPPGARSAPRADGRGVASCRRSRRAGSSGIGRPDSAAASSAGWAARRPRPPRCRRIRSSRSSARRPRRSRCPVAQHRMRTCLQLGDRLPPGGSRVPLLGGAGVSATAAAPPPPPARRRGR